MSKNPVSNPSAVEALVTAATPLSEPPTGLPALTDEGLATELARLALERGDALVIANPYTVCLLIREASGAPWQKLCCGDLGQLAIEAAKPLTRAHRLLWSNVAGAPWDAEPEAVVKVKATILLLNRWLKDSVEETGREGDVTPAIKDQLTYLAAWRCQFSGCGRDLKRHGATGGAGRFSYFAHIVAASPSGPRGDPTLSKLLSSELSNFMLLCDECHRLIDKVNPAKYTVEVLTKMREDSIGEVKRLLDSLQHRPVEVLAFLGNIAGQPAPFSMDDAQEALWAAGLRSNEAKPARHFNPGGQNHDVHSAAYWSTLFQGMKADLTLLQTLLDGTRTGTARPRLAIFPLHSTSVLLLAGRVLGDYENTHLFQPHRNKVGPGTRWAWPAKGTLPVRHRDKFKLEELQGRTAEQQEAILVVALTSDIEAARMPTGCAANCQLLLPTLRVTGSAFDKDCIQQPEDLQVLGLVIDAAIRRLQDEWHVRRVHLFVSAPATAAFTVGQKLQARHHAEYVCYEAKPGPGSAYQATIEIHSQQVRELVSGQALSLPLQL